MTATLAPHRPLPRDAEGYEHGTAEQIAARLTTTTRPITADRIRDWARRSRRPDDRLHGRLPGRHLPGARTGTTWYRLVDAAHVAVATRRDVR